MHHASRTSIHHRCTRARLALALLALGAVPGCSAEPSPLDPVPGSARTGASYIRLDLAQWEPPAAGDIVLLQHGTSVGIVVTPDASSGTVDVVPQTALDPTAPYELQLTPALVRAMEPYGPLWITPGDPDCDTSLEFQIDDDEDGLPDCAEKVGTYHWGMPLNYWGAEPGQTDVFVEVRYLRDQRGTPRLGMRPWPQALAKVRDEFLARGYVVHFDVGDLYEGTTYDGYEEGVDWSGEFNLNDDDHGFDFVEDITWVTPEPNCDTVENDPCVPDTDGWANWTPNNFLTSYVSHMMPGRDRSFYFVLFANSADGSAFNSGRAHNGSRNAIVTLGQSFTSFDDVDAQGAAHNKPSGTTEQRNKVINYQSAALMHEMGHMFGLLEGGDLQLQGKPNYLSTMSYAFMFSGLPHDDVDLEERYYNYQSNKENPNPNCPLMFLSDLAHGPLGDPAQFHIGYSDGYVEDEEDPLPEVVLDEALLDETKGIGPAPWGVSGPIDWNCDDDRLDTQVANYNITGPGWYPMIGTCGDEATAIDPVVRDHDDWGNLVLYHRAHFLSGEWPNAGLPFECPFP